MISNARIIGSVFGKQATVAGAGVALGTGINYGIGNLGKDDPDFGEIAQDLIWSPNQSAFDNALDILSFIPIVGEFADGIHSLSYGLRNLASKGEDEKRRNFMMASVYAGSVLLPSFIGAGVAKAAQKFGKTAVKEGAEASFKSMFIKNLGISANNVIHPVEGARNMFNKEVNQILNSARVNAPLILIDGEGRKFYSSMDEYNAMVDHQKKLYKVEVIEPALNYELPSIRTLLTPGRELSKIRNNIASYTETGIGTQGRLEILNTLEELSFIGARKNELNNELITLIPKQNKLKAQIKVNQNAKELEVLQGKFADINLKVSRINREFSNLDIDVKSKLNLIKEFNWGIISKIGAPTEESNIFFKTLVNRIYKDGNTKELQEFFQNLPAYKDLNIKGIDIKVGLINNLNATGTTGASLSRDRTITSMRNFIFNNGELLRKNPAEFVEQLKSNLDIESEKFYQFVKEGKENLRRESTEVFDLESIPGETYIKYGETLPKIERDPVQEKLAKYFMNEDEATIKSFQLSSKDVIYNPSTGVISLSTTATSRANYMEGNVGLLAYIDTKNEAIAAMTHDLFDGPSFITRWTQKLFKTKYTLYANPIFLQGYGKNISLPNEYGRLAKGLTNKTISLLEKKGIKGVDEKEVAWYIKDRIKQIVEVDHNGYTGNTLLVASEIKLPKNIKASIESVLADDMHSEAKSKIKTLKIKINDDFVQNSNLPFAFKKISEMSGGPYSSMKHTENAKDLLERFGKFEKSSKANIGEKRVQSGFKYFQEEGGPKIEIEFLKGKTSQEVQTFLRHWGSIEALKDVDNLITKLQSYKPGNELWRRSTMGSQFTYSPSSESYAITQVWKRTRHLRAPATTAIQRKVLQNEEQN